MNKMNLKFRKLRFPILIKSSQNYEWEGYWTGIFSGDENLWVDHEYNVEIGFRFVYENGTIWIQILPLSILLA